MMLDIIVACRTVFTYVVVLAYIAVVGPIGLAIVMLFRWTGGLYALGHGGAWLALTLAGIRYRVGERNTAVDVCVLHADAGALFDVAAPIRCRWESFEVTRFLRLH